ncbi:MAG: hypothetical protein FWG72_02180 [Oscillospiraceae bacterium]|nr:hypothetical protein [Oscillospiraceae bacterium]
MVTPELIDRLKQVNVSKDKDKSAERVKNAFSSATRKQKHEIEKLSGQKRTSIYRVFKTGSLSAKVLLPLAEKLNITPFWFTGETDEMEKCSDALILSFLDGRGYKNIASLAPKRGRKPASADGGKASRDADPDEGSITIPITLANAPKMRDAISELDADSASKLLHALYVRAKAGGNAEQLLEVVKLCLLS